MVKFKLEINSENEAMERPEDVAAAIAVIVGKINRGQYSGKVMDRNGNSVGAYDLEEAYICNECLNEIKYLNGTWVCMNYYCGMKGKARNDL